MKRAAPVVVLALVLGGYTVEQEVVIEEADVVSASCEEALDLTEGTILGLRQLVGWFEEPGGNLTPAVGEGD